MTDREILEKIVKNGGECFNVECKVCPLNPICATNDAETLAQAKAKLAEMDEAEASSDTEECPVPELKGVKMLVSANNSTFVEAYVYGKLNNLFIVQGMLGTIKRYKYAKPIPTTKTASELASDFRDHTLGEVMELGYVVTIKEND